MAKLLQFLRLPKANPDDAKFELTFTITREAPEARIAPDGPTLPRPHRQALRRRLDNQHGDDK